MPAGRVLEFGTPVQWVGMNPEQAKELAHLLRSHALLAKATR
jgi:hypothetical protein